MKVAITYNHSGSRAKGKQGALLVVVTAILLAYWLPILLDKLIHFGDFKESMLRHHFPIRYRLTLVGILPLIDALVIALLVIPKTNLKGMYLSFAMLVAFTGLFGIATMEDWLSHEYRLGNSITAVPWFWDFGFNFFFLILSGVGIYLSKKQRSSKVFVLRDDHLLRQ